MVDRGGFEPPKSVTTDLQQPKIKTYKNITTKKQRKKPHFEKFKKIILQNLSINYNKIYQKKVTAIRRTFI